MIKFLSVLLFIVQTISVHAQNADLRFEESLVIGEKESENLNLLFSGITNVIAKNNLIYITDASDNSIRVFNEKGEFKYQIGRRGRGPGEFQRISQLKFLGEDKIQALDRFQNRITVFSIKGDVLKTIKMNKVPANSPFFFTVHEDSKNYLVGYRDYRNINDGFLLHEYDSEFQTKISEYLDVFDYIFDKSSDLEKHISQHPSYLLQDFRDKVVVVSDVYTGQIFIYNPGNSTTTVEGKKITQYVEEFELSSRPKIRESGEVGFVSSSSQNGRFFYKKKGSNFSLVANNKYLMKFYALNRGKKLHPRVNIYNSELKLIADIDLSKHSDIFMKNNRFSEIPKYLDDQNNLYVADQSFKNSHPALRIFKLYLDEL